MLVITLPDGTTKLFSMPITGLEVAENISKSLSKEAIAVKINGKLEDLSLVITYDCNLEIVTAQSKDGLDIIRHDAAHILAQAVKELFPEAQVTIGPTIQNGFYYDFALDVSFVEQDLVAIEAKMHEIVRKNYTIKRKIYSREEAIRYFHDLGEHYKVELIKDIPETEQISIYHQGNFADLCRGPHSPSTGRVKAFKLMKISGSYWRGDSNNAKLQRIYGTAWATAEQLKEYLSLLEEAEKRDHRKIGKAMHLFHLQDNAPGIVFWHPRGWALFLQLIQYMRKQQNAAGYLEISTPEIIDRSLWEASGHWDKFSHNMFTACTLEEHKVYAVRPMNCPGGIQVFKQGITSYRSLPLRLAEFGKVYRFEPSGSLHGLMRVRAFTQDDAHIFCTQDQILEESLSVCKLILKIYKDFGFTNVQVKFSDRPEKRIGSNEVWDKAEYALLCAVQELGINYALNHGEGAFYGPKIEFVLKDSIGRDWQLGTLQVDLNLPERLGAVYVGSDGRKHFPVVLHRAILGSIERFIGVLLEHYSGWLPLWLAPVQVAVLTITTDVATYATEVMSILSKYDIRSIIDTENETLNYKVKQCIQEKIPILVIIGRKEAEGRLLSIRMHGTEKQSVMALDKAIDFLRTKVIFPTHVEVGTKN